MQHKRRQMSGSGMARPRMNLRSNSGRAPSGSSPPGCTGGELGLGGGRGAPSTPMYTMLSTVIPSSAEAVAGSLRRLRTAVTISSDGMLAGNVMSPVKSTLAGSTVKCTASTGTPTSAAVTASNWATVSSV
eukprot:scaffold13896_cov120-Isochrysis_galbana.AAC.2